MRCTSCFRSSIADCGWHFDSDRSLASRDPIACPFPLFCCYWKRGFCEHSAPFLFVLVFLCAESALLQRESAAAFTLPPLRALHHPSCTRVELHSSACLASDRFSLCFSTRAAAAHFLELLYSSTVLCLLYEHSVCTTVRVVHSTTES